jgi:hypothetical protein
MSCFADDSFVAKHILKIKNKILYYCKLVKIGGVTWLQGKLPAAAASGAGRAERGLDQGDYQLRDRLTMQVCTEPSNTSLPTSA